MAKRCPFWTGYKKTKEVCPPPAGGTPVWGNLVGPDAGLSFVSGVIDGMPVSPYTAGVFTEVSVGTYNIDEDPGGATPIHIQAMVPGVADASLLTWTAELISGDARTFSVVAPTSASEWATLRFGGLYTIPYVPEIRDSRYSVTPSLGGTSFAPLIIGISSSWGLAG